MADSQGAPFAVLACGTFCAKELSNLVWSSFDIGKHIRGRWCERWSVIGFKKTVNGIHTLLTNI